MRRRASVGWCSPSGCKSKLTLPTLLQLGYRYDASEKDDDRPYRLAGDGAKVPDFIILPNNATSLDDWPTYQQGQAQRSGILDNWIAVLDALMLRNAGPRRGRRTIHREGAAAARPSGRSPGGASRALFGGARAMARRRPMTRVVLITGNVHGTGPEKAASPGATLLARFAH